VLEIGGDLVAEQGIEHVTEELTRGRRLVGSDESRDRIEMRGPNAEHEQPVRTQVDRGRQRRGLSHRAVAEELAVQAARREEERNTEARHQVVERERHALAVALCPGPFAHRRVGLEEGHGARREITGRAQRESAQVAARDVPPDRVEIRHLGQQLPQR
jgi:hypothetical protein